MLDLGINCLQRLSADDDSGKELILNPLSITKLAAYVKIQPPCARGQIALYMLLSHDFLSGSDIMLCNKIYKLRPTL